MSSTLVVHVVHHVANHVVNVVLVLVVDHQVPKSQPGTTSEGAGPEETTRGGEGTSQHKAQGRITYFRMLQNASDTTDINRHKQGLLYCCWDLLAILVFFRKYDCRFKCAHV